MITRKNFFVYMTSAVLSISPGRRMPFERYDDAKLVSHSRASMNSTLIALLLIPTLCLYLQVLAKVWRGRFFPCRLFSSEQIVFYGGACGAVMREWFLIIFRRKCSVKLSLWPYRVYQGQRWWYWSNILQFLTKNYYNLNTFCSFEAA